jgi:hypothetical protein
MLLSSALDSLIFHLNFFFFLVRYFINNIKSLDNMIFHELKAVG